MRLRTRRLPFIRRVLRLCEQKVPDCLINPSVRVLGSCLWADVCPRLSAVCVRNASLIVSNVRVCELSCLCNASVFPSLSTVIDVLFVLSMVGADLRVVCASLCAHVWLLMRSCVVFVRSRIVCETSNESAGRARRALGFNPCMKRRAFIRLSI